MSPRTPEKVSVPRGVTSPSRFARDGAHFSPEVLLPQGPSRSPAGMAGPPAPKPPCQMPPGRACAASRGAREGAASPGQPTCPVAQSQLVARGGSQCVQWVEENLNSRSQDWWPSWLGGGQGVLELFVSSRACLKCSPSPQTVVATCLLFHVKVARRLCVQALVSSQVPIAHPQVAGQGVTSMWARCQGLPLGWVK